MNIRKLNIRWPQPVRQWMGNSTYGRILLAVLFVVLTSVLLLQRRDPGLSYTLDRVWTAQDLRAPFSFPIQKSQETLQQQRQEAEENVPPVFLLVPQHVQRQRSNLLNYLQELRQAIGKYRGERWEKVEKDLLKEVQDLSPKPSPGVVQILWDNPENLEQLRQILFSIFNEVYQSGFINREIDELTAPFVSLRPSPSREQLVESRQLYDAQRVLRLLKSRTQNLPPQLAKYAQSVFSQFVTPNFLFNQQLFEEELAAARKNVAPTYGKVREGELIVAKGQKVDEEIAAKIRSLNREMAAVEDDGGQWWRLTGQMILMALVVIVVLRFLKINRQEVYYRTEQLVMLLSIYLIVFLLVVAVEYINNIFRSSYELDFYLAVPVSVAPILITIFFDDRVGFFSNLVVALIGSLVVPDGLEFFFLHAIGGSFIVFQLKYLRRRGQFFTMTGNLLLVYALTYVGFNLFRAGDLLSVNYNNLGLFVLNMFFTLGTYPLIYIFERLFGITSNLTYMELLDTDHPLLKKLAIEAPGTYQHSLQVANIAEEAAKKIEANSLLAHVGALFHDIGKMEQPQYFIENQDKANPHEDISPLKSAKIIIDHVPKGVDKAREAGLPSEVIQFIKTHHGTSRVEYFYRQYINANPTVKDEMEEEFRYPGPRPTTKEHAVVMIADSVEAAARSLQRPSKKDLEDLVENIVTHKVSDAQLANARITFRDLNKIKQEVLRLLLSIYHGRIQYPDQAEPQPADRKPQEDPATGQPQEPEPDEDETFASG